MKGHAGGWVLPNWNREDRGRKIRLSIDGKGRPETTLTGGKGSGGKEIETTKWGGLGGGKGGQGVHTREGTLLGQCIERRETT